MSTSADDTAKEEGEEIEDEEEGEGKEARSRKDGNEGGASEKGGLADEEAEDEERPSPLLIRFFCAAAGLFDFLGLLMDDGVGWAAVPVAAACGTAPASRSSIARTTEATPAAKSASSEKEFPLSPPFFSPPPRFPLPLPPPPPPPPDRKDTC